MKILRPTPERGREEKKEVLFARKNLLIAGLVLVGRLFPAHPAQADPPLPDRVPPPDPPSSATSALRLDLLPDEECVLFLSFRVEPWLREWNLARPDFQVAVETQVEQIQDRVDPRGLGLMRMVMDPGVFEAALAVWPTQSFAGIPRPVWMIGLETVPSMAAEPLMREFLDSVEISPAEIRESRSGDLPIFTLPIRGGHLHYVANGNRLVLSTERRMLLGYLASLKERRHHPEHPRGDLSLHWRPLSPNQAASPLMRFLVQSLGAERLFLEGWLLDTETEIEIGIHTLPRRASPVPFQIPNPEMLGSIPLDSDAFLLAGGLADEALAGASEAVVSPVGNDPFLSLFEQPFSFGVALPSSTLEQGVQLSGVYREPWGVVEEKQDIQDWIQSRLGGQLETEPLPEEFEWEGLKLEKERRGEWVLVGNTGQLRGQASPAEEWITGPKEKDTPPLLMGALSPRFIQYGLEMGLREASPRDWQWFRGNLQDFLVPLLEPVRFSVWWEPEEIRLRIHSPSGWSGMMGLLDSLFFLDTLLSEGPRGVISTYSRVP